MKQRIIIILFSAFILGGVSVPAAKALDSCPDKSSLKDGICYCQAGYDFDAETSTCIESDLWCKQTYGDHIFYNSSSKLCECEADYGWSESKNQCITKTQQCREKFGTKFYWVSEENLCFEGNADGVFYDVPDDHKNRKAILYLRDEGIISGYDDGTFKPDKTVNRAELLKILVAGNGVNPDAKDFADCFLDVKDEWFAPYVCYAKEQNWVSGYEDGTFKPAQTVNKVEALKMLLNSQGIEVLEGEGQWFAPYVAKADELNILEENKDDLVPAADMSRAGIAENLYRLISKL